MYLRKKKVWLALLLLSCAVEARLPPPPTPSYCAEDGEPCELDDDQHCCEYPASICNGSYCISRTFLVPDSGMCDPDRVDLLVLFDISGSMRSHLAHALNTLTSVADNIPESTRIGLVTFPAHTEGGWLTVAPLGDVEAFRVALALLEAGPHSTELAWDVVHHYAGFDSVAWRFGASRVFVVLTDEAAHSNTGITRLSWCDNLDRDDRVVTFTLGVHASDWSYCAETRTLGSGFDVALVNPCL